jgi:hypothetical protein
MPVTGTNTALPAFDITPASNTLPLFQTSNYGFPSAATGSTAFDVSAGTTSQTGIQQIFSTLSVIVGALAKIMKANEGSTSTGTKNPPIDAKAPITTEAADSPSTVSEVPPPPANAKADVSDGYIDTDTQQQGKGDCVFLSTTRGLSQTAEGRADIKNAIKANNDGSFDVKFAGADKSYHVTADQAKQQGQWANGDKDMQILGTAADAYFKDHGQANGAESQSFSSVSKLLTGKDASNTLSLTGKNSVADIKNALIAAAPDVGKTKSIGLSGGVTDSGDWKAKDTAHEFQVESIDTKTGTVTYTNPWDTSKKRTISMDDLAKQLVADPNGSTVDIFGAK